MSECLVFVWQQSSCISFSCEGTLEAHNAVINVRYFGVNGLKKRKLSLRCNRKSWRMNYHPTTYGNRDRFYLYDDPVDVIETTDGIIIQQQLL